MGGGQAPLISDNGTLWQVSAQLQTMVTLPAVKETLIPIKIADIEFFGRKKHFSPVCNQIRNPRVASPCRATAVALSAIIHQY